LWECLEIFSKAVLIIIIVENCLKITFYTSQGSATTFIGKVDMYTTFRSQVSSEYCVPKIVEIDIFHRVIKKIEG